MGVVGRGGGSEGWAAAGFHFPRDSFNNAIACLLSKSPALQYATQQSNTK